MAKNVQISTETFLKLAQYFYLENDSEELRNSIRIDIEHKIDALMRHQLYSDYKQASSEHDREVARQKYLDAVGIQEKFRWSQEWDNNNRKKT